MADPVQSDARNARLAAALRANLARRKARDRGEPEPATRHPGDRGDATPDASGNEAPPRG